MQFLVFSDPKGTFSFTLFNAKIRVAKLHPGMSISSMIIEVVTSMVSLYRKWEALIRMPESSLLAKDILAPFRPKVFGLANELNTESAPEIPVNKVSYVYHCNLYSRLLVLWHCMSLDMLNGIIFLSIIPFGMVSLKFRMLLVNSLYTIEIFHFSDFCT